MTHSAVPWGSRRLRGKGEVGAAGAQAGMLGSACLCRLLKHESVQAEAGRQARCCAVGWFTTTNADATVLSGAAPRNKHSQRGAHHTHSSSSALGQVGEYWEAGTGFFIQSSTCRQERGEHIGAG